ncbi:hypothetical protein HFP57_01990 [Parasphingopyxis algicola]|uniref:hypothetical protein n=1 Tax=Parasphingopyxis algicola TaxID=2026624 RepID=UPI0015A46035|nr:hypothetical protein [Parasphingopyxis algicola]QLC23921.1 hypothetical protein HFP57_01990 [Parasphingopyxis algicola]
MRASLKCVAFLALICSTQGFAQETDTLGVPYGGRTILLMVPDDDLAVPFTIQADGTMKYIDIHLDDGGLSGSYVRTVAYELRGEQNETFCVIKESPVCFDFPELTTSVPVPVNVVAYDTQGAEEWTGGGLLMLMEERSPFAGEATTGGE